MLTNKYKMDEINIYELQKLWKKYQGRSGPKTYPKKKKKRRKDNGRR